MHTLLINPRSGIVLRTVRKVHHPSIPASLCTVQAHVAAMHWSYPDWHNDVLSGGSAFDDPAAAYHAALGEAVERYCGNYVRGAQAVQASYHELYRQGKEALDPERLVLFSEQTYAEPGCPFVPFTRATRTYWVRGHSLSRDCAIWVPVSQVYINWRVGPFADAPLTHGPLYAGIAAGTTREQAVVSGLEEWIERDTTMVWWLNQQETGDGSVDEMAVAVEPTKEMAQLWEGAPTEAGQCAWLLSLSNEFGIPVMAGVVEHTRDQLLTVGFACRHDPMQAALKAWSEALILQEGSRDLLDPHGAAAQAVADGWFPSELAPWRADRRYLDDVRSDFRDITHLLQQQQLFLDPRAIERVRPWLMNSMTSSLDVLPRLLERTLAAYRERIERHGYEIIWVDLTTADVAAAGLRVVRVLVPGLVPNFPAAFPPLGRGRVQMLPLQLGWRNQVLDERALNLFPMPHA